MAKVSKLDFTGKQFYIGIDVHHRQWTITIRSHNVSIATLVIDPSPDVLKQYLDKNYPGGAYYSVYEAGYCGFWIHRQLCSLGIKNIVINPADVPTTDKERRQKTDSWDSIKLSRELCNGSLRPIFIPDEYQESLRALCRLRERTVSHQTRLRNRIKGFLAQQGVKLPHHSECYHWSGRFMNYLKELKFDHEPSTQTFRFNLQELEANRSRLLEVIRALRKQCEAAPLHTLIKHLTSVPGVGFVTAITFMTEIMDMERFSNSNKLNTYIGFAPSTHSSGEKEKVTGITPRKNRFLRSLLIESAWIAIHKDPALLSCFMELTTRMPKQRAIIRIAKKLVNRLRYVWLHEQSYVTCVVE